MSCTIGIDEVGRGCLAGPVVVAVVAVPDKFLISNLKDSKKLSPEARRLWCQWVRNQPRIKFYLAKVYPAVIDRINISQAANLAATRAFLKLGASGKVFLDGGLKLNLPVYYQAVIKGDEKINAIKLASIIAKVYRDELMFRAHRRYPDYHFDQHKGYGTTQHVEAIKNYGLCPLHRLTFLKNITNIRANNC